MLFLLLFSYSAVSSFIFSTAFWHLFSSAYLSFFIPLFLPSDTCVRALCRSLLRRKVEVENQSTLPFCEKGELLLWSLFSEISYCWEEVVWKKDDLQKPVHFPGWD